MRKIAIFQNDQDTPQGLFREILQANAISYDLINAQTDLLPDPANYAAIIILGGAPHIYEIQKYPYLMLEEELLRQAITLNIPCLGICLGSQLLAKSLGSTVKRHHMTEVGFFAIPFTEEGKKDPLLRGLPGYQTGFHWHEDTFDLPEGAILLASNHNTKNQVFRYGTRAYGIQYHIELDTLTLDKWLYEPRLKANLLKDIGEIAYENLKNDRIQYYSTYKEHTKIFVENFLYLSELR